MDNWSADPDRTTRQEGWKQVEDSALAVANNCAPISIKTLTPPPPERHLSPWLVTALLAGSLLVAILAFIGATS